MLQHGAGGVGSERGLPSALRPAGVSRPGASASELRVLNAKLEVSPPVFPPTRGTPATQRGLRFEKKALTAFTARYGSAFLPHPSFSFQTCARRGRCIPDGILLGPGNDLAIIEIKYRHSGDAWWQLEQFYAPIVREALRFQRVVCAEVCHVFDPAVKLPKPVALIYDLEEAFGVRECFHPVMVVGRH